MIPLPHDRRASISVELAMLAHLVLLPLVLGAADAGALITARSRLDQVLHAALFYAYANNGSVTGAAVASYAAGAYGDTAAAPTVSATTATYCITPATGYPATGTPAAPNSGGTCASSSQSVQTYLVVSASVAVALPFAVPWTAKSVTLRVAGRVRIA